MTKKEKAIIEQAIEDYEHDRSYARSKMYDLYGDSHPEVDMNTVNYSTILDHAKDYDHYLYCRIIMHSEAICALQYVLETFTKKD